MAANKHHDMVKSGNPSFLFYVKSAVSSHEVGDRNGAGSGARVSFDFFFFWFDQFVISLFNDSVSRFLQSYQPFYARRLRDRALYGS
jgi:hypothetical protein